MGLHARFVKGVDLRCFGASALRNDFRGDNLDRCAVAPGEKNLRPLARKGACDSTADFTRSAVDHRNLVLKHHVWVDTAMSAEWASANRPVRRPAGVYK